jgi:hypothetical protein
MTGKLLRAIGGRAAILRTCHAAWVAAFVALSFTAANAQAQVSQTPLFLGGGNVPGNLALVPSVEWPTIHSMANLGAYTANREYLGYFDPNKCYGYAYADSEPDRHFYPVGLATNRQCSGYWSGNYMNCWVTSIPGLFGESHWCGVLSGNNTATITLRNDFWISSYSAPWIKRYGYQNTRINRYGTVVSSSGFCCN